MKTIPWLVGMLLLLAGCSTPHFNESEGRELSHVYQAGYTNTFRAAVRACQRPPLSVQKADEAAGLIDSKSPMRWESWGEKVHARVIALTNGTEVTVIGNMRGPHVSFAFNWSYDILKSIAADLGEPLPPAPSAAR